MSPAAQSAHTVPRRNCQHEPEQDSFKCNEQDLIPVADTIPPIGHEVANAVRRRRHVIRQLRPSPVRADARDGMEQVRSKVLSATILDGIDQTVDPAIGRVDRSLTCRYQPDEAIEFGTIY